MRGRVRFLPMRVAFAPSCPPRIYARTRDRRWVISHHSRVLDFLGAVLDMLKKAICGREEWLGGEVWMFA